MMDEVIGEMWFYPLRWGDTLSNHDWMPLYIHRFLQSRFKSYACGMGQRAEAFTAILLWCESMRQNPAGTLPDDDIELANLAGFGADVEGWRHVREGALYGWGDVTVEGAPARITPRLGHAVVAEVASDMFKRKRGRDQGREAAKIAVQKSRVRAKLIKLKFNRQAASDNVVTAVAEWLVTHGLYITDENVRAALEASAGVPKVVAFGGGDG